MNPIQKYNTVLNFAPRLFKHVFNTRYVVYGVLSCAEQSYVVPTPCICVFIIKYYLHAKIFFS